MSLIIEKLKSGMSAALVRKKLNPRIWKRVNGWADCAHYVRAFPYQNRITGKYKYIHTCAECILKEKGLQ